jgi:crotonobetainyl-CoA:carnitine CoA-transferase CaiB-like acyl-CoA transferase
MMTESQRGPLDRGGPPPLSSSRDGGAQRPAPLAGVVVLDLGRYYLAPYAGFLLAMAGADVIKVEAVDGEPMRGRKDGTTSYAQALLNANKRNITLNLKHAAGRELLRTLVQRCDVLLENFAPGQMDRMGVGYRALSELNPRLIYGSGTGFGLDGPDRDGLALDPVIQAHAGVVAVTGPSDGMPFKAGPAIADFSAGTHLYAGVATALYERERTGRGRLVEIAMQEALYPTLASNLATLHYQGKAATRAGNRHGAVSPYNLYRARDGYVAVLCTTEEQWRKLLLAMNRPELADDPRFTNNKARLQHVGELDAEVEAWTQQLGRAEVFAEAKRHGIPAAAVRDLDEVMNDPHMHGRGMLAWLDHPELGRVVATRSPIRYHGSALPELQPSARLGQHNDAVYGTWLGLNTSQLDDLRHARTI